MIESWRQKVLDEALTWKGTPYHHMARIKGAGVDCMTFIVETYAEVGLINRFDAPFYRPDFMRHRKEDHYLEGVLEWGDEISESEAQPADMVLYKWGRIHAHSALILDWPQVIHALNGVQIALGNSGRLARPRRFFTLKRNAIHI